MRRVPTFRENPTFDKNPISKQDSPKTDQIL